MHLSPDAERRLLDQARERTGNWVMLGAAAIDTLGLVVLAALGGAMFILANRV